MTKHIQVNVSSLEYIKKNEPKGKSKKNETKGKSKKKKVFCNCPIKIKERLTGYEEINNIKDTNVLIPRMSCVQYINKKDGGLRPVAYFLKSFIAENSVMLIALRSNYIWKLSLDNYNIFAKMNAQENVEKIRFVNFLENKMNEKSLSIIYNGKKVSWVNLVGIYEDETL